MEPLKNIQTGTLYNPDKSFLMKIRFTTPSRDAAVFLFSEKPEQPLPEYVLLVPDAADEEEADDFIAYRYFLTGEWISYKLLGNPCFLMNGSMNTSQNLRQDLRVKVSFQIEAVFDNAIRNKILTVKDISAGGFFFVCKERLEAGTRFSFVLTSVKKPVYVSAEILRERPMPHEGLIGYSCKFVDLAPAAESAIRQFVFQKEALQKKAKKGFLI